MSLCKSICTIFRRGTLSKHRSRKASLDGPSSITSNLMIQAGGNPIRRWPQLWMRRAMSSQGRPRRADAERNRERVLASAEVVLARDGLPASMRAVTAHLPAPDPASRHGQVERGPRVARAKLSSICSQAANQHAASECRNAWGLCGRFGLPPRCRWAASGVYLIWPSIQGAATAATDLCPSTRSWDDSKQ